MQTMTIAFNEIKRMLRNKAFYFILFVLPLLLILILGSALSGAFSQEDRQIDAVKVAVVNEDQGLLSDGFRQFLNSDEVKAYLIAEEAASREAMEEQVRKGKADFGLVIPSGFSDAVLQGKPAEWEFVYGRNRTKNMTADNMLQTFLRQTNTVQSAAIALGPGAAQSVFKGSAQQEISASGASLVQVGKLNPSGESFTSLQYYSAQNLIMFLLYAGMMAAVSLIMERDGHTLLRLCSMPVPASRILAGKVLGQSFLSFVQAVVIILGTSLLYGVKWGNGWWLLLAICLLTIVSSMSLAVLITLLVKSLKAAVWVFQSIIIVMTALSGGFSTEVSGWMETFSRFTLSYWSTDGILRIMLDNDFQALSEHLTMLGLISAGLIAVSFGLYRKVGYHE